MQDIKELIGVLSKHKVKQIEVIGNNSSPDSSTKFNQLYELIRAGEVMTDTEAISLLYDDKSINHRESYAKLKNRLKTRLINTLFFIDVNQPQFTDIQRAFFTCNKNWLAARTLLSRGATRSAIKIAEVTIRESLKYEFTEMIIYLSKMLFWHYSLYTGHPKKYQHYLSIHDKANQDLEAENYGGEILFRSYASVFKIASQG